MVAHEPRASPRAVPVGVSRTRVRLPFGRRALTGRANLLPAVGARPGHPVQLTLAQHHALQLPHPRSHAVAQQDRHNSASPVIQRQPRPPDRLLRERPTARGSKPTSTASGRKEPPNPSSPGAPSCPPPLPSRQAYAPTSTNAPARTATPPRPAQEAAEGMWCRVAGALAGRLRCRVQAARARARCSICASTSAR